MFAEWQPAAWMADQRCEDDFRLYGGQVTVSTPGLYYLYAQVRYWLWVWVRYTLLAQVSYVRGSNTFV